MQTSHFKMKLKNLEIAGFCIFLQLGFLRLYDITREHIQYNKLYYKLRPDFISRFLNCGFRTGCIWKQVAGEICYMMFDNSVYFIYYILQNIIVYLTPVNEPYFFQNHFTDNQHNNDRFATQKPSSENSNNAILYQSL